MGCSSTRAASNGCEVVTPDLDAAAVRALLVEVGAELDEVGMVADLFLVGGAAVALA